MVRPRFSNRTDQGLQLLVLMNLFDKVGELPLVIDGYDIEPYEQLNPGGFRRLTSVVQLEGGGCVGRGEDTSYAKSDHKSLQRAGTKQPLAGRFTLQSFSEHLDVLELWPDPASSDMHVNYRRWAYESAALELALRQARVSLAEALGRKANPASFVVSTGLGTPPSLRRIEALLAFEPRCRFKLDTSNDWDASFVSKLAALDRVDIVDFKGAYSGTAVDQVADAKLYSRVIEGLPHALLEDPHSAPSIRALLDGHWSRVTWDAAIHSASDVAALDVEPQIINIKPSRCGTLRQLLELYEYCEARGVGMYGGGQFELADGRRQIQEFAGIFHPDGPNDIAPIEFNRSDLMRPVSDRLLKYTSH
ncbi:MAG: L-alanine-DL-glutamate epimerase-like enolase superfamily enzyme [Planctomycetota bacterium]